MYHQPKLHLEPQPGSVAEPTVKDLKGRARKGGFWVTAGYGAGQALRLGSNLILTRLLAPEVFGVVALVQAFISGLEMFSDAGMGLSIVQSKSGTQKKFLNTAWTMQVLRGLLIAAIAALIAPLVGRIYEEPAVPLLLIVSAAGPLAKGFAATSMFTAARDLQLGRRTLVELLGQSCGLATAISWASVDPSPWALVAAAIAAHVATTIGSHILLPRRPHNFTWDKESASEMARFGFWIFLGSICGFVANHADRLVVGKLFSMAELGMYSIATMLVRFVVLLYQKVSRSLLFPIYAAAVREESGALPDLVKRTKLRVFPLFVVPLVCLAATGDLVVQILFDDRYLGAGPMLQLLAVAWTVEASSEAGPSVLAHGNSRMMTSIISIQAVVQFSCMLLGGLNWGATGLLLGLILARFLVYPLRAYANHTYKTWFPSIDGIVLAGATILGLALYQLKLMVLPYLPSF